MNNGKGGNTNTSSSHIKYGLEWQVHLDDDVHFNDDLIKGNHLQNLGFHYQLDVCSIDDVLCSYYFHHHHV